MYKQGLKAGYHRQLLFVIVVLMACGCTDSQQDSRSDSATHSTPKSGPQKQNHPANADRIGKKTPESKAGAKSVIPLTKPLDLNIDQSLSIQTSPVGPINENSVLPDLFINQDKKDRVKFGGKLITNDREEGLIESVEGVEISIDISTP